MPRKQRREKRRQAQALSWSDLDIPEQLDFLAGWRPEKHRRSITPYKTWLDYLELWEQVREDGLAFATSEPFAEQIRRGVMAGESPENAAEQIERAWHKTYLRDLDRRFKDSRAGRF